MQPEPTRRSFMATVGATAAVRALLPDRAIANPDPDDPAYRSAGELVQMLASRQISSRELVDSAIARIDAIDPEINAVVVRDFDRARAAADAADAALASGERRPLLGLPMTVKEQFNIAGLPTTWGDPKFKDWRPEADALVVQRLKSAGRSSSARPTCRSASGIGKVTMRSTARPTIPGTLTEAPAALQAARRRRSQRVSCPSNSARTSAARCGRPHISAASFRTSRASTLCRYAVPDRHRPQPSRCAAISP